MNLRQKISKNRLVKWPPLNGWMALIVVWFAVPACVWAGGGPENVVLVVNADSASSKMLANYYIQGRNIPSRNVIYLNNIPDREVTSWKLCKREILEPLVAAINERKLTGSIDYIIYSSDFPTAIEIKQHRDLLLDRVKKQAKKKTPNSIPAKVYNAEASITSLTYFLGAALQDEPGYMRLDANNYYRNQASVLLRRPFLGDQQIRFEKAIQLINSDSDEVLEQAIEQLMLLGKENPKQLAIQYWLAKFYGKRGDAKSAVAWLTRSIRLGWCYRQQTESDLAFEKVKNDPMFKGIVASIPDIPFEFAPTHGFKNRYLWGPNGMLNTGPGQGNRHFLSSILAVTRNQGISEKSALQQLKRAMRADESKPQGTFYFTDTKDVRSTTRKPNFDSAVKQLEAMGFGAQVIKRPMPYKVDDVIGLTCGTPRFNWIPTGSKLLPGAFCDNLTSFGGAFHKSSQTKCTEFLTHGAAGASGTVVEPYALQAKFPHPMIHVHYARGCTMAESFYQSVHGPFQTIVVGDALCQPWATKPVLNVQGISSGDVVKGVVQLKLDDSKSPTPIESIEFFVDGILVNRVPMRDEIAFDTSKMSDGFHEVRLVAIAKNLIQSTGRVVLPIRVNNGNQETTLTTKSSKYLDTDQITFQAVSTFGDSIELMHNGRSLAKRIGTDVEFQVSAKLLGRGPVRLQAVAISERGAMVASQPVELEIQGRVSNVVRITEVSKPKKNPKRKPTSNKKPNAPGKGKQSS